MTRKQPTFFILHDLIRRGQLAPARRALRELARRAIPRDLLAETGLLAWRLHSPDIGLRLLHRLVRPPPRSRGEATDEEKVAYAACLTQAGALEEGLALLDGVDAARHTLSHFVRATAHIASWEYGPAISPLRNFLHVSKDPYWKLVARVNLAACLVYERKGKKAEPLVAELTEQCRAGGHSRLLAAVLEIAAIRAWEDRDWDAMGRSLDLAERILKTQGGKDSLHLGKWRAVLALSLSARAGEAEKRLRSVREEAVSSESWETVRDCDHWLAVLCRNEPLLWKVYFGTPFAGYREKLLLDFGGAVKPPPRYSWAIAGNSPGGASLSLATGRVEEKEKGTASANGPTLPPGEIPHRLLAALCQDFYRPHRTLALHAKLYPGEHYNPASSPARIRQALRRLRRALKEATIPIGIEESDGAYRLTSPGRARILVDAPAQAVPSRESALLDELRRRLGNRHFVARDASEAVDLPGRTVRRAIQRAVDEGVLEREGKRRAARYRFR